jgi:dihydroorotate dehydrogenase (NAD+) catalytic subunit
MSADLNVDLGGLKLENPVLLASGTAGYGLEVERTADIGSLGGVILKSVTVKPRQGNPAPRVWETAAGMLNSIGLENVGLDEFCETTLPQAAGLGVPLVASIAGTTVREFASLAARIHETGLVKAIETNVSCPNVEKGGIQFGVDTGAIQAVVTAVRENSDLPLFVKLSAAVNDIAHLALAAAQSGATGLSLINTVPGLAIDALKRRPRLGGVTGGLSGPAIKPIALKAVWECHRATGLPIIGGGGIFDVNDALEFIIAGASALAMGTVLFKDPCRPAAVARELAGALERIGATGVASLVGTLKVEGTGKECGS